MAPANATTEVARRYHRFERPISGVLALAVGAVGATALLLLPLFQGLVVTAVLLALVRFPAFRTVGTTRLATDAAPEQVRAEFTGPTPPLLAFQWGPADSVRETDDGTVYEFSYLFGLRSTTMTVSVRAVDVDDSLELTVTAGERPWATYTVDIGSAGEQTTVDVSWDSDRRFGLNRLPQWYLAERYREAALAEQGYTVVERDASLSV